MGATNEHESTPDQLGFCRAITNLDTANFTAPNGNHFCIDNENDDAVMLSVKFANDDTFISKKIYPGPNSFLLKEIELNEVLTSEQLANLKYGY